MNNKPLTIGLVAAGITLGGFGLSQVASAEVRWAR